MRFSLLKSILSRLFIIPEHRFESEQSGPMDIRWEQGRLALNSATANYSYNHLHTVMESGLRSVMEESIPQGPILNLGMGAGSTVSILRDEMGVCQAITSVEYDPQIITVAREYFNLNRFDRHEVICADAYEYVMQEKELYALIIIDLFKDRKVDSRFIGVEFISRCAELLLSDGAILFNYLGAELHPAAALLPAERCEVLPLGDNRLLIYRNTERS